jgi:hypothetical protein
MDLLETAIAEMAPVLAVVIMVVILALGAFGWWLGISSGKPRSR